MDNRFFEKPILNSPYEYPKQHWELDDQGQPTQQIIEHRRRAEYITPIPKPKKRKGKNKQQDLVFDEGKGLSTQELADMACERITAGITRSLMGKRPVKAVFDPYTPVGSTMHVNFNTSRKDRWETDARRCHINWVIFDSDWEAEFCRVAESHPRVKAYVKNHNLGLEVPYRYGSETRTYLPDFIVLVDDGHGEDDPLHLIVEIKGYRREDAKAKKSTMETYWVPGVNNHGTYGRWAFAEFTEVYQIESDFEAKVEAEFNNMIERIVND